MVNDCTGCAHLRPALDRTRLVRLTLQTALLLMALAVRKLQAKNFFGALNE